MVLNGSFNSHRTHPVQPSPIFYFALETVELETSETVGLPSKRHMLRSPRDLGLTQCHASISCSLIRSKSQWQIMARKG